MATPLQTGSCFSRGTDLQNPQKQFRRPCDVTVVVKDGKEFDTHGHVLSEASPFFEKLLGSEMRERKERKIRLEMLTEQIWGKILSFIYSGTVQIHNEQDARDLISMADYFLIKQLKKYRRGVLGSESGNVKLYFDLSFCREISMRRTSCRHKETHSSKF